jgi:hypothetical protein
LAVREGKENQDRLEMNGTHHILICTDVKLLDESVNATKKNMETLLDTARIGLEVNAGNTVCLCLCHQNAGKNSMKISNISLKNMAKFIGPYLRTT